MESFVVLGGQKYQHDNSLDSCVSIHLISTLFLPRYDMRRQIGGKFHGVAPKIDDFMSIAMFRGDQGEISRGAN